jgi:hypothetical protein
VWNAVGGALGYWAVHRWRTLAWPAPRTAVALAAAWATLWGLGTVATAWSLAPLLSRGKWVSHVGAPASARGAVPRLERASLDDAPLRTGWLARSDAVRDRLLGGGALVAAGVVPNRARAVNVLVVDDGTTGQVMAALQRSGNGLAYTQRTRAASLRLRSPSVTLPDVLRRRGRPGDDARRPGGAGPRSVGHPRRRDAPRGHRAPPELGVEPLLVPEPRDARRAAWFSRSGCGARGAAGYWAARGWGAARAARGWAAPRRRARDAFAAPAGPSRTPGAGATGGWAPGRVGGWLGPAPVAGRPPGGGGAARGRVRGRPAKGAVA